MAEENIFDRTRRESNEAARERYPRSITGTGPCERDDLTEHGPEPRPMLSAGLGRLLLVLHLRTKGWSLRAIALKAGCSLGTVQRLLDREQAAIWREYGQTKEEWTKYVESVDDYCDTPWPPRMVTGLDGKRYPGERPRASKRDQE